MHRVNLRDAFCGVGGVGDGQVEAKRGRCGAAAGGESEREVDSTAVVTSFLRTSILFWEAVCTSRINTPAAATMMRNTRVKQHDPFLIVGTLVVPPGQTDRKLSCQVPHFCCRFSKTFIHPAWVNWAWVCGGQEGGNSIHDGGGIWVSQRADGACSDPDAERLCP